MTTSEKRRAAISATRMPASQLSISKQRFQAGKPLRATCCSTRFISRSVNKGTCFMFCSPLTHKKRETSMFSDVQKSNRRDSENDRCDFSGLQVSILSPRFYETEELFRRLKLRCSAEKRREFYFGCCFILTFAQNVLSVYRLHRCWNSKLKFDIEFQTATYL